MSSPGERQRLHRDDIVAAALDLLDEVGLENLSLRRLATSLGVSTPTLYWHFANKQDLMDAMSSELLASVGGPDRVEAANLTWDEWLTWLARQTRQAVLARRDGAMLFNVSRPSARMWSDVEQALALLTRSGFSPRDALIGIGATLHFVIGGANQEQQRLAAPQEPGGLPQRSLPLVADAIGAGIDPAERFEVGLNIILDGMRARLR